MRARPLPTAAGVTSYQTQKLNAEAIHLELHALREAKIALDKAVALSPSDLEWSIDGVIEQGGGRRTTAKRRPLYLRSAAAAAGGRQVSPDESTARHENNTTAVGSASVAGQSAGRLLGGITGGTRSRRPPLAEVQIDPDLPLPLPAFPGYVKLFACGGGGSPGDAGEKNAGKAIDGRYCYPAPSGRANVHGSGGGGGSGSRSTRHPHGLFVPGVVAPRQRQSHGLPQELRAIFSIPKPEQWPGNPPAIKRRAPRRPKPMVASMTTPASNPGAPPPPSPPKANPPPKRQAWDDQDNGGGGSGGGGHVVNPRPRRQVGMMPGSAAAAAAAREQRKHMGKALEELRNEMREREERLMAEFERFRRERAQRVRAGSGRGGGGGGGSGHASGVPEARSFSAAARRPSAHQRSTAVNNRTGLSDRKRRPRSSALYPAGRRFTFASAYGSRKPVGVVTWVGRSGGGAGRSTNRSNNRSTTRDDNENDHNNNDTSSHVGPLPVARVPPVQKSGDDRALSESTPTYGAAGAAGDDKQRAGDNRVDVETAEAQVQTAVDAVEGVHIFLPPAPAPPAAVLGGGAGGGGQKSPLRPGTVASGSGRAGDSVQTAVAARGVSVVGAVERGEGGGGGGGGEGIFEGNAYFGDVAGQGATIPPPPVMLIEGEGRNVAWRPADDDRLLPTRGDGAGGGGGRSLPDGQVGQSQGDVSPFAGPLVHI